MIGAAGLSVFGFRTPKIVRTALARVREKQDKTSPLPDRLVWRGVNGDAGDAANWSPSRIPRAGDTLVIYSGTVRNLQSAKSIELHGGTLECGSPDEVPVFGNLFIGDNPDITIGSIAPKTLPPGPFA